MFYERKVIIMVIALAMSIFLLPGHGNAMTPDGFPEPLGTIKRPNRGIPVIQEDGKTIFIECTAAPDAMNWDAGISTREGFSLPLTIVSARYGEQMIHNNMMTGWLIEAEISMDTPEELYDLTVSYFSGGQTVRETNERAVKVVHAFKGHFHFVHLSDTHLFYDGFMNIMMRRIIDEINLIDPIFVIITGDVADHKQAVSKIHYILKEFDVPVYCIPGNHDIYWSWWPFSFWGDYYWQLYYSFTCGCHEDLSITAPVIVSVLIIYGRTAGSMQTKPRWPGLRRISVHFLQTPK